MALITLQHFSESLHMCMTLQVILPEKSQGIGIDSNRVWDGQEKLPVLYLLHGNSDDHSIWQRRTSLERYLAGKKLAVVMPTTHLGTYTNQQYGFHYFDYISQEVPSICQAYFPISPEREKNFIAGLSMGGYGALKIGLHCLEKFSYVAALSAGVDRLFTTSEKVKDYKTLDQLRQDQALFESETYFRLQQFIINFGSQKEYMNSLDNNLFLLVEHLQHQKHTLPKLMLICGHDDPFLIPNQRFHQLLSQLDIDHLYLEAPGSHDWSFWDQHIQQVVDWLPL